MHSEKKWGFIINPIAGNGYAANLFNTIEQQASKHQLNFTIAISEYHMHEKKLAQDLAVQGYDYIIAVGGDGTLHHIVSGLLENELKVTVGLIPAGSGNDIIPMLGFKERFKAKDWDVFFACHTINMDIGVCNGKFFINGVGLGIDADIAESKCENAKQLKEQNTSYIRHIIKSILTYQEKPFSIIYGEQESDGLCFIHTIGNGRRYGGGYNLTPQAIANDGVFDICWVTKLSILQRLLLFTRVPGGTHIKSSRVKYYQTDRILLQFNEKLPYHLDGEVYYDDKFMIDMLTNKLNIIYNPNGKHYFNEK